MPEFAHVVTLVALVIGPAGVVLGWALNEKTDRGRDKRSAEAVESAAARARVLEVARLARLLAGEIRSLAHATYLSKTRAKPVGFQEFIAEFNQTRTAYRAAVLELRVFGPSWAVEPAETFDLEGQRWTDLISAVEQGHRAVGDLVKRSNEHLSEVDAMVDDFVALLATKYNADAAALPARPDLDSQGTFEGS